MNSAYHTAARFLSTGTVAIALGCTRRLISLRCASGQIEGARRTGEGESHWRIPAGYVVARIGKRT